MVTEKTALDHAVHQLRPVVVYAFVMSFFINLLILPMSLFSLQVYDRVMSTGSIATLIWLTVIMLCIFAAVGTLQTLRATVLSRAADWLYNTIAAVAIPISIIHVAAARGGTDIQSLRDAGAIKRFLAGVGLITLLDAPWAVLYIAVLFIIHYALGLLVTGGAAALILLAWLSELSVKSAVKEASKNQIKSMQELEVAARNAEVVEAMGMTGVIVTRWHTAQQIIATHQEEAAKRAALLQGITKFLRLSLQVLVTTLSAWLALQNEVTFGAIIASSILASRALAPLEAIIGGWKTFAEARNAFTRLQQTLLSKPRIETISLPVPEGKLSVEYVSYSPPHQQRFILKNVHFGLQAGETLGIIGPSGSGKSSLARLITGTWKATSGIVRLDDADVYSWPRNEFGRYIGYLPQDIELFGGSVRDNIARLRTDASDEEIVTAAKLANAHELILRLPQGYNTEIGTSGELLSAGQRQRIGLARAFFGSPRVLVLDEPDSNLDDSGQIALVQALQHARAERITTLVISHRRAILNHVDKILLLKEGGVEAFGSAADIMAKLSATFPASRARSV